MHNFCCIMHPGVMKRNSCYTQIHPKCVFLDNPISEMALAKALIDKESTRGLSMTTLVGLICDDGIRKHRIHVPKFFF